MFIKWSDGLQQGFLFSLPTTWGLKTLGIPKVYSADLQGSWHSVLIPGGEPVEPQARLIKNHPRVASQAEGERNDNGVSGLVRGSLGSPIYFREISTDLKRTSSQTYFGTLSHWCSQCLFWNSDWVPSFCFVRWSSLPGLVPSVASCFRGLTTFLYQTEREDGEHYYQSPGPGEDRRKPGCGSYYLLSGQEDGTPGDSTSKAATAPSCPQAPSVPRCLVLQGGWSEVGTCEFQSAIPNSATVWSPQSGGSLDHSGCFFVYAPLLGIKLERAVLNLAKGYCHFIL